jgi:hypothetical protein
VRYDSAARAGVGQPQNAEKVAMPQSNARQIHREKRIVDRLPFREMVMRFSIIDASIDFKPLLLDRIFLENFQPSCGKHIRCQRSVI